MKQVLPSGYVVSELGVEEDGSVLLVVQGPGGPNDAVIGGFPAAMLEKFTLASLLASLADTVTRHAERQRAA